MATISQINGNELAGKEFYDYVRTVGAVLFSFNPDFSPAARYGGSWENITDRFLIGAGGSYALGSTGGSADAVVVEHSHQVPAANGTETASIATGGNGSLVNWGEKYATISAGESGAGKNIPPYIAVNIWRRVA